MTKEFIITIFTENHFGLLNHIAIIFTRRRMNIESLTGSETERKGISRVTIVLKGEEERVIKVVSQINKIIEVMEVYYNESPSMIISELALYKVKTFEGIKEIIVSSNAKILKEKGGVLIIEKTGSEQEIYELLEIFKPNGLIEFVRSGNVAMVKS